MAKNKTKTVDTTENEIVDLPDAGELPETNTEEEVENVQEAENKESDITKPETLDVFKKTPKPLTATEAITVPEGEKPRIFFPGVTSKDLTNMYIAYGNIENADESNFSEDNLNTFSIYNYGLRYHSAPKLNGFVDRANSSGFTNKIEDENKNINLRTLSADDIKGNNISQSLLLAQIVSKLGAGEKTNIPLWHSGFRVVITPPSIERIIMLHNKIAKDKMEAGKDTLGLSFSNDSCILHQHFLDMFVSLIDGTTLDIDLDNVDIRQYISVLDLNIIYLAVQTAISASGIDMYTNCANTSKLTEDGKPLCTFSIHAKVDPARLLWVDTKRLMKPMLKQMGIMSNNRVTVEQVKWYQEEVLKYAKDKFYTITTEGDEEIKVYYKIPNILEFITEGLGWVLNITNLVKDSLTGDSTETEKEDIINSVKYLLRLGTYNAYVDYIIFRGNKLTDRELITKALTTYGKSQEQIENFLEFTLKYIEEATLAIVGFPAYECPKCKEAGREALQKAHQTERLKELIPLQADTLFFDLAAQQLA